MWLKTWAQGVVEGMGIGCGWRHGHRVWLEAWAQGVVEGMGTGCG